MLSDIGAMERQITFLNKRLESIEQTNSVILTDKNNLERDYLNLKRVNENVEGSREDY